MAPLLAAVVSGVSGFAAKVVATLMTEKMIAYVTFYFLEQWVKSTETNVDNELVAEVKKAYYKE